MTEVVGPPWISDDGQNFEKPATLHLQPFEDGKVSPSTNGTNLEELLVEGRRFNIDELAGMSDEELRLAGEKISEYHGRLQNVLSGVEIAFYETLTYQTTIAKLSADRRNSRQS